MISHISGEGLGSDEVSIICGICGVSLWEASRFLEYNP